MYDVESHIAEIYDKQEDYTDDVELIRRLIGKSGPLSILEPFCGTGRISIPLAQDGHSIVGLDQAEVMLGKARSKISMLPEEVQSRIFLQKRDVIDGDWPRDFDLVILGGNCLYELATAGEQEKCIKYAAASLRPRGHVYMDNNHMEGELAYSWQKAGVTLRFPSGRCTDGTSIESEGETIWFDAQQRLARFRRRTKVTFPDGRTIEKEYIQQKHPVSTSEVQSWLEKYGFTLERVYGDRAGNPYVKTSDRAIFWAIKR